MNRSLRKIFAAFVMAAVGFGCLAPQFAFADNKSQLNTLQQQQTQLQTDINSTKTELKNTKIEKNAQLKELNRINSNIDAAEKEIDALQANIAELQGDIDYTEAEIANKQRDYDGRLAIFCRRLKEMYQYGDADYMEVLFQASSFGDFLTRFEYLSYIANNDKQLLAEVIELQNNLEAQKKELEEKKNSMQSQIQSQQAKIKELEVASAEKASIVAEIKSQEDSLYAILDAMEEEANQISASIAALQTPSGTAPSKGSLVWPAPASRKITSPYGSRIHPIKKTKSFHTGIDIGAGNGTNILAAASGKVIVSAYSSSYGNYVVVDHGGGLSTLYAHMSKRMAAVGDSVTAGKVIGLVGSTGMSTGPHLHFEVRINGKHTSPNSYLGI